MHTHCADSVLGLSLVHTDAGYELGRQRGTTRKTLIVDKFGFEETLSLADTGPSSEYGSIHESIDKMGPQTAEEKIQV